MNMPDEPSINISISIEELHLHNPLVETEDADNIDFGVDDFAGLRREFSGDTDTYTVPDDDGDDESRGGGHIPGPRPGGYDIRDRPAKGLALETVAESDGVTPIAVADIHDLKANTVRSALRALDERGAVTREEEGGRLFYCITDFGERVLEEYRQRWRNGYRNLPMGFWEGIPENSA